ncbi:TonB family protein [Methylomagnum sp.]
MPITIAFTDLFIDKESSGWRPWGRYGLVLMVSAALHLSAWQFRGILEKRLEPKPKPDRIIEVILTPPPKLETVAKAPEPMPKREEPKRAEPKPQPKPVALPKPIAPPRPKAPPKPKPVVLPRPDPKPEPPPAERDEPVEDSTPAKTEPAPPEPVSRPVESSNSSATAKTHATDSKRDGGAKEAGNSPAHYLQRPSPEYPAVAKRRNWEGRVVVRVKILADGSCGQAEIHQSSGHDVLDEAALEAVCKVRYAPNKRNGQAVEGWANVPINFNLEG